MSQNPYQPPNYGQYPTQGLHHGQFYVPPVAGGQFGSPPRPVIGPQGHPPFMNQPPVSQPYSIHPGQQMHPGQFGGQMMGSFAPHPFQHQQQQFPGMTPHHLLPQTSVPNPNVFSPFGNHAAPHSMQNQGLPPPVHPGMSQIFSQQFANQQRNHQQQLQQIQRMNIPQQLPPSPARSEERMTPQPLPPTTPVSSQPPQPQTVTPSFTPEAPAPSPADVPYFDLPAGLMVPIVKLEDWEYKPIDPKEVKLPVPAPPSERLLKAVEAFYAPPSHDRPRDAQGWEKLALYEYYKVKLEATKGKAGSLAIESCLEPLTSTQSKDKNIKTLETLKNPESPPRRMFKEEPSPMRQPRRSSSVSSNASSRSSSSRSPSPPRKRDRSSSSSRKRRKSSTRKSRSPSPDSYKPSFATIVKDPLQKLEESNKGHQLLKKMGWSGTGGLGSSGKGIEEPINPLGDIRDTSSKFRGIVAQPESSSTDDPYESYRRSKGQAFMDRIVKGKDDK